MSDGISFAEELYAISKETIAKKEEHNREVLEAFRVRAEAIRRVLKDDVELNTTIEHYIDVLKSEAKNIAHITGNMYIRVDYSDFVIKYNVGKKIDALLFDKFGLTAFDRRRTLIQFVGEELEAAFRNHKAIVEHHNTRNIMNISWNMEGVDSDQSAIKK